MISDDVRNTNASFQHSNCARSFMFRQAWHEYKAIKLKLLCFFIHVYLQATCEMIKYFASLILGDATCKS